VKVTTLSWSGVAAVAVSETTPGVDKRWQGVGVVQLEIAQAVIHDTRNRAAEYRAHVEARLS